MNQPKISQSWRKRNSTVTQGLGKIGGNVVCSQRNMEIIKNKRYGADTELQKIFADNLLQGFLYDI